MHVSHSPHRGQSRWRSFLVVLAKCRAARLTRSRDSVVNTPSPCASDEAQPHLPNTLKTSLATVLL